MFGNCVLGAFHDRAVRVGVSFVCRYCNLLLYANLQISSNVMRLQCKNPSFTCGSVELLTCKYIWSVKKRLFTHAAYFPLFFAWKQLICVIVRQRIYILIFRRKHTNGIITLRLTLINQCLSTFVPNLTGVVALELLILKQYTQAWAVRLLLVQVSIEVRGIGRRDSNDRA